MGGTRRDVFVNADWLVCDVNQVFCVAIGQKE